MMKNDRSDKIFKKLPITMAIIFIVALISTLFIVNLYAAPVTVGSFVVDYVIQSDWGNGATISVTLKNNGPAINGWTVGWTFPGNQTITNLWNGTYTQSGASVSVKNASYNAAISTNGSVNFGFNLNYSGSNTAPTSFTVNSSSTDTPTPTQRGIATPTPTSTPTPTRRGVTPTSRPSSTQAPTATPTATKMATPTPTRMATPTPTRTTTKKFHCFLLLGQSNMAGYAKSQAADKVEDPRVLVLGYDNNPALGRVTDQWDAACPPLHPAWLDAIGPGDWFGKTMIPKYPAGDTIGLIPCAISGEKIETFMKVGGTKYTWIINRARLAQQAGGVIEGMLFHQGESNNGDPNWPGKVKTFVTDLRNDLGLGNAPFLAGELLYGGACAGHNTLVNQLPSLITNCYVISASGLVKDPSDTYNMHFGHDSVVEFGKRYAAKMITALGL